MTDSTPVSPTARLHALLQAQPLSPAGLELLRDLLDAGADPNAPQWQSRAPYRDELTPLHILGLDRGSPVEAARLLLGAGADLHARSARSRWTPLHIAAGMNHTALVDYFLDEGADPDAVAETRDEPTPLVGCIFRSAALCLPTVERLLRAGADPNLILPNSPGPLHRAVDRGNVEVIRALVEAGADRNARTGVPHWGQHTALMEAASRRQPDVLEALLELGADLSATAANGKTAVHTAVFHGRVHHTRRLLSHGADATAVDDAGHTPLLGLLAHLHRATPLELVELLLQHGADPKRVDAEGTPTLQLALRKGDVEVVRCLVAAGASVDQPDASGRSARALAPGLPALLRHALGLEPADAVRAPTRIFLEGLASGLSWTRGESSVSQVGEHFLWSRPGAPYGRFTAETLRELVAWLAFHDDEGAESLAAWYSQQAEALGRPPWTVQRLTDALVALEPELVERVRLPLEPGHAPEIIEAGVRAGFVPCRHDKEGFWTWTFLPDAPESTAFRFHEAGNHNPRGTTEDTSAEALRRFFAGFRRVDGRLSSFRREDLDGALNKLGYETERQWLQAQ